MKPQNKRSAAIGLIMIALTVTSLLFASSKGTLKGHVKDKGTGDFIPFAQITATGKGIAEFKKTTTDASGQFTLNDLKPGSYNVEVSVVGYTKKFIKDVQVNLGKTTTLNIEMVLSVELKAVEIKKSPNRNVNKENISPTQNESNALYDLAIPATGMSYQPSEQFNTEQYNYTAENEFHEALRTPLSTFSIDVDPASYANMRRFINSGTRPPADAVRIEEMINYFKYDYPQPQNNDPFSINTEVTVCPWNKSHQIVSIGLQGKNIKLDQLPPSNLVFLLDVSGSMMSHDKLPLLKNALGMLTDQLRSKDRVAIVVYAGNAGLVLPSTSGTDKASIHAALEALQAGGSTAGGAGIQLAYQVAKENFILNGNNRVILATDGDFNIGVSSDGELVRMIEEKREQGVFLTVLGFGTGNLKDSKMEQLANKGNGNYAYIDNIMEAKKVLVTEMGGTLFIIAKDVKLQLEFNPAYVKAYKLIGYENRLLQDKDFNDDKKDAGELGSGHTVTALYEIVPAGSEEAYADIDPLKYQKPLSEINSNGELLTIKFRYKDPQGETSKLITRTLKSKTGQFESASINHRFASSVAAFGLVLRDSKFKGDADLKLIEKLAREAKGTDEEGYRAEFIRLVEMVALLK